jgi:autotransporter-associated beta strand protein
MRTRFVLVFVALYIDSHAQVLPLNRYYNKDYLGGFIWDNTASNGQVNNGSGNWNGVTPNWIIDAPLGPNVLWTANRSATFGGNLGVGAAGTVTVIGTQLVKSFTFQPTPSGNFLITGGNLSLSGGVITTYQTATIASTLDGGGNFIKTGNANLILTGNNNLFSGNITISQGGLFVGTSTAAGTTDIVMGNDNTGSSPIEWRWAGGVNPANNITVTNNGTGLVRIGGYSNGLFTIHTGKILLNRNVTFFDSTQDRSTHEGIISGNIDTITIDGAGTWNPTLSQIARVTLDNDTNTFTARIIIRAGKALQFSHRASGTPVITAANNNPIEANGSLVLWGGQNFATRIGALSGASTGVCEIHTLVATTDTLILSVGHDNGSGTYNGIIRNGLANGQIMKFTKEGTGVQVLTGTSPYTGITVINGGTLGGTGTLSGTVSTRINAGARIMGGTGTGSAGIFNVRNLIFTSGTNAAIDVYSNGTTLSRVAVTGTCALGTISRINLLQAMPAGTFDIITSTGAMTGTVPTIGTNSSGRTVSSITVIGGNTLRIVLI